MCGDLFWFGQYMICAVFFFFKQCDRSMCGDLYWFVRIKKCNCNFWVNCYFNLYLLTDHLSRSGVTIARRHLSECSNHGPVPKVQMCSSSIPSPDWRKNGVCKGAHFKDFTETALMDSNPWHILSHPVCLCFLYFLILSNRPLWEWLTRVL